MKTVKELALRIFSVHPREIQDLGLTRTQWIEKTIRDAIPALVQPLEWEQDENWLIAKCPVQGTEYAIQRRKDGSLRYRIGTWEWTKVVTRDAVALAAAIDEIHKARVGRAFGIDIPAPGIPVDMTDAK